MERICKSHSPSRKLLLDWKRIRRFPCWYDKVFCRVVARMVATPFWWNEIPFIRRICSGRHVVDCVCVAPMSQHHAIPYLLWRRACSFIPREKLTQNQQTFSFINSERAHKGNLNGKSRLNTFRLFKECSI